LIVFYYAAHKDFSGDLKTSPAITSALVYPSVMVILALFRVIILITRILHQNIMIFESMGLTVPFVLRFVNYLVHSIQYHWL